MDSEGELDFKHRDLIRRITLFCNRPWLSDSVEDMRANAINLATRAINIPGFYTPEQANYVKTKLAQAADATVLRPSAAAAIEQQTALALQSVLRAAWASWRFRTSRATSDTQR